MPCRMSFKALRTGGTKRPNTDDRFTIGASLGLDMADHWTGRDRDRSRTESVFGALAIGSRLHPSPSDPTDHTVTPDQLEQVIGLADVVVLAAPATPETENLVDADFLGRMKSGGLLVNVARGTLIQDDALLESLDSGHQSAAVLDVFRTEPLPSDHPFWSYPSVRVTPQNARRWKWPVSETSGALQGEPRSLRRRSLVLQRGHERHLPSGAGPNSWQQLVEHQAASLLIRAEDRLRTRLPLQSRIMLLWRGFSMCSYRSDSPAHLQRGLQSP